MNEQLWKIVENFRKKGILIGDSEVEKVYEYCVRKMKVLGKKDWKSYMPALFEDEVRNYVFRSGVNALSSMFIFGKEGDLNVYNVHVEPM